MKTIKLTGRLAKEFGDEFVLDVVSPAEAVRALCALLPDFEESVRNGEYRVTRLYDGEAIDIDEDELHLYFGQATGLCISPVVGGSKNGLGKLIIGIVLIGVAFFAAPALLAGFGGAGGATTGAAAAEGITIAGISATKIGSFGALMALQGAAALLTPTPPATDTADANASHLIDATGNLLEQGNPVPIA